MKAICQKHREDDRAQVRMLARVEFAAPSEHQRGSPAYDHAHQRKESRRLTMSVSELLRARGRAVESRLNRT